MPKKYVIMLDKFLDVHLQHNSWPISYTDDDLNKVKRHQDHDERPDIIPTNRWRMILLENKSLINTTNGNVEKGRIYETQAVV